MGWSLRQGSFLPTADTLYADAKLFRKIAEALSLPIPPPDDFSLGGGQSSHSTVQCGVKLLHVNLFLNIGIGICFVGNGFCKCFPV